MSMTLQLLLLRELKGFLTPQLQLNILHLMGMGNPTTTKLTIPICYLSHLLLGTKPKNQGMNYAGSEQVQKLLWYTFHTVLNLHFLSKNSTLISRENCRFFGVKNLRKCCGFGLFSCWQLWFHEKNCQKKFGWKTRENVGVLSKLNIWTKISLFE